MTRQSDRRVRALDGEPESAQRRLAEANQRRGAAADRTRTRCA
ncbi:hypothetical protein [Embleya sp. AB8]